MIAKDFLNPCNTRRKGLEVPLDGAGKDLHQRPTTNLTGKRGRKIGQACKCLLFGVAMHAFHPRVQQQKDAPIRGKRGARNNRRHSGVRTPSRVDNQAAALEQGRADP